MTRPVLAGPDAQVFDLLARICAIVERQGIGTTADVVRICNEHLAPQVRRRQHGKAAA